MTSESEVLRTAVVFTPATVARRTFVERPGTGEQLRRALDVGGRPICVVGPYRCGKTTLTLIEVERNFPGYVHLVCKKSDTFDQLLLGAFDLLGPYYTAERSVKGTSIPAGIAAEFLGMKAQLAARTSETTEKSQRVVSAQLTSRALARFAAAADSPWIIDDVHKLPPDELIKVAEAMREWQTLCIPDLPPAKMVVIGTEQASSPLSIRLISAAPDLQQRLAAIPVSLMSREELSEIILSGAALLNVDFSEVLSMIIDWSYGYPGVCQDLCYYVCIVAGIQTTSPKLKRLTSKDLQSALKLYDQDCSPAINQCFVQMLDAPIRHLPPSFAKLVFDQVALGGLAGRKMHELQEFVGQALDVEDDAVIEGLTYLADDETGVLTIERETSARHAAIVQFREPMYFINYQLRKASKNKEADRQAQLAKFYEIMRQG